MTKVIDRLRHDPVIHDAAARALHKENYLTYSFTDRLTAEGIDVMVTTAWAASARNRKLWIDRAKCALMAAADALEG